MKDSSFPLVSDESPELILQATSIKELDLSSYYLGSLKLFSSRCTLVHVPAELTLPVF